MIDVRDTQFLEKAMMASVMAARKKRETGRPGDRKFISCLLVSCLLVSCLLSRIDLFQRHRAAWLGYQRLVDPATAISGLDT